MDKRSVCGIHQADNAVIDADWHFGSESSEFILIAELLNQRSRFRSRFRFSESRALRAGFRHINPDKTVLLLAGIAAGVDAVDFQILAGSERRDELALAVVHIELPAVIAA